MRLSVFYIFWHISSSPDVCWWESNLLIINRLLIYCWPLLLFYYYYWSVKLVCSLRILLYLLSCLCWIYCDEYCGSCLQLSIWFDGKIFCCESNFAIFWFDKFSKYQNFLFIANSWLVGFEVVSVHKVHWGSGVTWSKIWHVQITATWPHIKARARFFC